MDATQVSEQAAVTGPPHSVAVLASKHCVCNNILKGRYWKYSRCKLACVSMHCLNKSLLFYCVLIILLPSILFLYYFMLRHCSVAIWKHCQICVFEKKKKTILNARKHEMCSPIARGLLFELITFNSSKSIQVNSSLCPKINIFCRGKK